MNTNLVLIHLESLNNLLYRLHPEWFPAIREIEEEGVYFSNYYSSATSTIMVISDLIYGSTDVFEQQRSLTDIKNKKIEIENFTLFDILRKKGYGIKNFLLWGNWDVSFLNRLVVHDGEFVNTNDHDVLADKFEDFILNQESFALFLDDCSSALDFKGENRHLKEGRKLKREGFLEIDATTGILVKTLKKCGKYENTLLVLYGDHGDDFWAHGLHDGYSHALAPYQHMVHTPLIIAGAKKKSSIVNNLIGTSDLREFIFNLLEYPADNLEDFCPQKDVVYSRNLFANQKLAIDSFNKSYSATDGRYLLMVSNYGLEMYLNDFDVNSVCNLLDFFVLVNGELKFYKQLRFTRSTHFNGFWTEPQIEEVQKSFLKLFKLLLEEVKHKYKGSGRNYKEMKFDKIHYLNKYKYEKKCISRHLVRMIRRPLSCLKRVYKKALTR